MDRLLDGAVGIANLHRLQSQLERMGIKSSHLVLGSESCHCPTTGYAGGDIAVYWSRAERYAHTILADLAAGSHGWVEWNLILDGIGGPNHLGNLCESTLLAVPHRAVGVEANFPPLPDFEHNTPMGNVSIGDGRTREELNALGFPAKYLDVGVVVQPIYYYMGHISRYVRPGSIAVMGLATQALGGNRIFRPKGQVVAGGGQNDLARDGIELTVWPCEGSTRQQFTWDVPNRQIQVYGHDWLGHPTKSCVGRSVDTDLKSVLLTSCTGPSAGVYEFVPVPDVGVDTFKVVVQNHPKARSLCLVITELKNKGGAYGPLGGAQVALGSCDDDSAKWRISQTTGEAMSTSDGLNEVCLTTGWPFLQMGAFSTPTGETSKAVVVLNEAGDAANYAIQEGETILITCTIPPRSIQTVLIE
jgi:glucosylceramidase